MRKKAEVPSIPRDLLKALYSEAAELYALHPWEHCSDVDIFGVEIPETQELHFVSVMGAAGECFGLATYRGIEGLALAQEISSGEELDPVATRLAQDGLLLEFVSKRFLDEFDKKAIKDAGFTAPNPRAWVLVRDLSPGWVPWGPEEKDIVALRHILSVVPEVLHRQKRNPEWTLGKDGRSVPVFAWNKPSKAWKLSWRPIQKLIKQAEADAFATVTPPMDELALERVKRSAKPSPRAWITHSFYSSEPVLEGKRPFFPKICALLEDVSGYCFGIELARPTEASSLVLRNLLLKHMESTRTIPSALVLGDLEHLPGLDVVAESLGIGITPGPSEHALEFEDEFRNRTEGDTSL